MNNVRSASSSLDPTNSIVHPRVARNLFRSEEVTIHDIQPDNAELENENEGDVRKLIALIKITDFVKATPGQKLEIRYRDGVGLELWK